ncbi:MAG TPA: AraC family transcriptional regulator [Candidatus Methylacidiphilales bacterium]|jgi:AraC family transcriptional regulator|nr:AraC family transcriptional regulator [Candidatus Methylacidiphilales bacterium]
MRQLPAPPAAAKEVSVTNFLRRISPLVPAATSDGLGWGGVEALRFFAAPSFEIVKPGIRPHTLVLITSPPEKLELEYDTIKCLRPPPAGSIVCVPSGMPMRWRWKGPKDSFHLYLDPQVITRVAAESFGMSVRIPPLDVFNLPELRGTMLAFAAELARGAQACRLLVESLTTVLAVQLIRHVAKPRVTRHEDAPLPRPKLERVVEFISANLDNGISLTQLAGVAFLSPYHFARQFKTATGLPPHKYVVARRVERAQQLMREERESTLADIALRAGFSDQSQLCAHFKRIAGMTPRQFQVAAKIA